MGGLHLMQVMCFMHSSHMLCLCMWEASEVAINIGQCLLWVCHFPTWKAPRLLLLRVCVESLGYQIRKPLSSYSLIRGKHKLTCILETENIVLIYIKCSSSPYAATWSNRWTISTICGAALERYPQLSVCGVRLCVHVTRTSNSLVTR